MSLRIIVLSILAVCCSLFIFPTLILANNYIFQEEFSLERTTNQLDTTRWKIYLNSTGTRIQESGGFVKLPGDPVSLFPYVVSKTNPFPTTGDFTLEFGIQYLTSIERGTGLVISLTPPANNIDELSKDRPEIYFFGVWQDAYKGFNVTYSGFCAFDLPGCTQQGTNIYNKPSPDLSYHTIKLIYSNYIYEVYVDGNKMFTSPPTTNRPQAIWFGNPVNVHAPPGYWTSFKIDYIRVLTPPQPFLDLPWDYEGKGLSFNEAALSINSFFDHQYPLLSAGLAEPATMSANFINFSGQTLEESDTQWYSSHDGYDYGFKAKVRWKDSVLAAASGSATYIDPKKSDEGGCIPCGNMIIIDHGNGYQTRYLHLDDSGLITSIHNQSVDVSQGQEIGKVGFTGNVKPNNENGAHIHFGVFQDKDGDGNFDNNIPDGVTDPFGWQSNLSDPWPNYIFNFLGQNRTGNKSYYLWKHNLVGMVSNVTPAGTTLNPGNYTLTIPKDSINKTIVVNAKSAPIAKIPNNLASVGSALFIKATDLLGNPITNLVNLYQLVLDFSKLDISKLKADTLSFYSSSDGVSWTKEDTTFPTETSAQTQLDHFSYFALMGERRDITPPITTAKLLGTEGQSNWFKSDVNLTLEAQDNDLGVYYTAYRINEEEMKILKTPLNFTSEGHYKIEFYSVDEDENTEEIKSVEFDIDKTPPTITGSFTPSPNLNGWNNTAVTVHFECSDNLSGIDSCPEDTKLNTEGAGQTVLGIALDKAGNSASFTVTPINIDKTAPRINLNPNPNSIWPPNDKMVNVTIEGFASDANSVNTVFTLIDEYGLIHPTITYFGQRIQLKASRYEEDKNGRIYTISATSTDLAGNTAIKQAQVLVPHDQRTN